MTTFVDTKDSRVKRDIESKALVASNASERDRIRSARALSKRVNTTDGKLDSLEQKVNDIQGSLTTILSVLSELTKK